MCVGGGGEGGGFNRFYIPLTSPSAFAVIHNFHCLVLMGESLASQ